MTESQPHYGVRRLDRHSVAAAILAAVAGGILPPGPKPLEGPRPRPRSRNTRLEAGRYGRLEARRYQRG